MAKEKRMKRKEIVLGLQGILVAAGMSGEERRILQAAIDRLQADKHKISDLKADLEFCRNDCWEEFINLYEMDIEGV